MESERRLTVMLRKKLLRVLIVSCFAVLGGITVANASATTYGDASSGASNEESFQIRYNGAAWNYGSSPYQSTSFTYTRNGTVLMKKTAYNGKVSGSVWDDLRWGDKYTTKFYWGRGSKR